MADMSTLQLNSYSFPPYSQSFFLDHAHDSRSFSIILTLVIAALLPVCTSIAIDPTNTMTHEHRYTSSHVYSNGIPDTPSFDDELLSLVDGSNKVNSVPKPQSCQPQRLLVGQPPSLLFSPPRPLQPTK
ncbi:hypothetical protein K439DRAFT_1624467 [Ramaria rubella]|nr:hypothetical protein K439DRAFT_1624467 [Ramaria rubella]